MQWLEKLQNKRSRRGDGLTVGDVDKLLAVAKAAHEFCRRTRDLEESSVRWELRKAVKELTGEYWELF